MVVIRKCCHSKNKVLSFRPKGGIRCCFVIPTAGRNPPLLCHSDRREESAVRYHPDCRSPLLNLGCLSDRRRNLLLAESNPLLGLATDALANQIGEAAFRSLTELVIVRSFLADDKPSAVIAGVKPFRAGRCRSVATVKTYASPHLDKRSALRQFRRSFVLDPH
jgi:hypothetical protein